MLRSSALLLLVSLVASADTIYTVSAATGNMSFTFDATTSELISQGNWMYPIWGVSLTSSYSSYFNRDIQWLTINMTDCSPAQPGQPEYNNGCATPIYYPSDNEPISVSYEWYDVNDDAFLAMGGYGLPEEVSLVDPPASAVPEPGSSGLVTLVVFILLAYLLVAKTKNAVSNEGVTV